MKIVALSGLLGYGYTEEGLRKAFEQDIDYIGVDGGSTDPGPYYLGSGTSFTNRQAVKRDIQLVLPLALERKIPFVIGTAGGAGGEVHLQLTREIIEEIAREKGLKLNMALIHSEISKEYVKGKLQDGKVIPFSNQLKLTEEEIENSTRFVGQIGVEPFIEALDHEMDVILAGRACDTAIYASPAIKAGYDPGLAFHMAKIMECGSMCAKPISASDVMVAEIQEDHFILEPANPIRKCLIERVAAHTLYEQANPYYIYEPDGVADLRESTYEQCTERSVKVMNSKFIPTDNKTIKIEGVKLVGYRTISIGGVNEQQMIDRISEILDEVKKSAIEGLNGTIDEKDYQINFRIYGGTRNGTVLKEATSSMGVVIDVLGKTQEIANMACAIARSRLLHFDYSGRKTTAGNIAFPYSPSDVPIGPVYNFSAYHLVEVDDFSETSQIEYIKVGETNE